MYLWDVKHKDIDRKHFKLGFTLCEADTGKHGLGYEWYYMKRAAQFHRSGNKYACLTIYFLFAEILISLNWGDKAKHDETWRRLRSWEPPAKV
jgi:hypothetical protein